jgi:predicted RNase H-like HicB family nuclease
VPRKEVADKMTFRVVFTKEGKDWTVIAPDVHPAHSWGPTLKSAAHHIKEAIALVLDLPADAEQSIELDAEYRIDGMNKKESSIFHRARDARHSLHDAQEKADETLRQAIEEGRKHGLSMRDIATMTDVSYQRVAQISSSS